MDKENDTSPIFRTGHYTTYKSVRNLDRKSPYSFTNSYNAIDRPGSTATERPGSKSNLAALKENNFPPTKPTFSRLYSELYPSETLKDDVESSKKLGSHLGGSISKPSEDFLPKIKNNDFSINESKTFKSILKPLNENGILSSSRNAPSRNAKYSFDLSENGKTSGRAMQKQKTVMFAQNANDDSFVSTDFKENRVESASNLDALSKGVEYPSVYPKKKEVVLTTMKTKKEPVIPQSGSAAMFVEKRSYFNKLTVDVGDEKYLKSQNLLTSKFNEMREKLANLKDAIANS